MGTTVRSKSIMILMVIGIWLIAASAWAAQNPKGQAGQTTVVAPPKIEITPAVYDFGEILLYAPKADSPREKSKTFTVKNAGGAAVKAIVSVKNTADAGRPYNIDSSHSTCLELNGGEYAQYDMRSLPPGGTCSIVIIFKLNHEGSPTAVLSVSSGTGLNLATAAISGRATYTAPAASKTSVSRKTGSTVAASVSVGNIPIISYGQQVRIEATVKAKNDNNPVAGAPLDFRIGTELLKAETGADGVAYVNYIGFLSPGSYPVEVSISGKALNPKFVGNSGREIEQTKATATLRVVKAKTEITFNPTLLNTTFLGGVCQGVLGILSITGVPVERFTDAHNLYAFRVRVMINGKERQSNISPHFSTGDNQGRFQGCFDLPNKDIKNGDVMEVLFDGNEMLLPSAAKKVFYRPANYPE